MTLTESLNALVSEHDRIGSPLRSRLRPGRTPAEVEKTLAGLGLQPPDEVVELFGWHEIHDPPGADARVSWFWPGTPYRLDEVVRAYRQFVDIGGVTPDALAEFVRDPSPASTFTGFWRTDWLPILYGEEDYAIECGDGPRATGAVWRVNWHPDPQFETARLAVSLTLFVERIVELFRLGAYEWSDQHQAVMPIETVFAREGLGDTVRPWPSVPPGGRP